MVRVPTGVVGGVVRIQYSLQINGVVSQRQRSRLISERSGSRNSPTLHIILWCNGSIENFDFSCTGSTPVISTSKIISKEGSII